MRGRVNSGAFDARTALVDRLPHMEPQPTLYDALGGMPGLGIRDEHRQHWLELMSAAVDDTFPDAPDLRAPLMSYFEWGTAIAQEVSQDPVGTDLGDPGPTPRWGREGLQA